MHSMAALETANSCVKLNIFSLLGNKCYFKNDFSAQVKVILLYSPFLSALRSQKCRETLLAETISRKKYTQDLC